MAGILKVDTIQNANASNIVTQANATTITVGAAGQTVSLDGGIIKSGSTTLTIGTSGQTVALASGATSSGFGATYNGAVNWSTTVQTTGFTAVTGTGYFCNTTAGAFTVTLPATPSAGAIVAITDYAGTAATNKITIARNGSKIEGADTNAGITVNRDSVTLVYIDSTQGWLPVNESSGSNLLAQYVAATGGTITTSGDYKIHTFTGSGTFTVSCAGNPAGSSTVDYLVVAGGAGSGSGDYAGGGGAGGFRQNFPSPAIAGLPVTATAYPITVGSGGSAGASGNNSIFSTITSTGGGFGGSYSSPPNNGGPGGSGGGGASNTGTAGTGNTPPVSPSQGLPGGAGSPAGGAGGGGSGGSGANGTGSVVNGGPGTATLISGSPVTYSAGGRGAGSPTPSGPSGAANTGNAGGVSAGSGGSGIVVIRYKFQ
jgi:hypothetical protein